MNKTTHVTICGIIFVITSILIRLEIAETWMALIWAASLFSALLKLLKK